MVSYGLLAELTVNGRGSGEVVPVEGETVRVDVRVLGPHWVTADRVELFANGQKIREQAITPSKPGEQPPGVKWSGHWTLPRPRHDVHLVAIACGPGIDGSYWKTAKPYQPTSPHWEPQVIGCSGAVWLDADGDGEKTFARRYAERAWKSCGGDLSRLLTALADYDATVAAHAADFYHMAGGNLIGPDFQATMQTAAPPVREGFQHYFNAWRETQTARAGLAE
jgi:hypothetical protein